MPPLIAERSPTKNRYTNVAAYIEAMYDYKNAPGRIVGGKMEVYHNDEWISSDTFRNAMTRPDSLLVENNFKGDNKCTKAHNLK